MILAKTISFSIWVNCWHHFLADNSYTYVSVTPTQCSKRFCKFIFSPLFKVAAGATEVAVFGSASESFSKKNINCSIDESMRRFEEVINAAKEQQIPVRGLVFSTLDCHSEWMKTQSIFFTLFCHS